MCLYVLSSSFLNVLRPTNAVLSSGWAALRGLVRWRVWILTAAVSRLCRFPESPFLIVLYVLHFLDFDCKDVLLVLTLDCVSVGSPGLHDHTWIFMSLSRALTAKSDGVHSNKAQATWQLQLFLSIGNPLKGVWSSFQGVGELIEGRFRIDVIIHGPYGWFDKLQGSFLWVI